VTDTLVEGAGVTGDGLDDLVAAGEAAVSFAAGVTVLFVAGGLGVAAT